MDYVNKAYEILKKKGKIIGLLFNKEFELEGPPFGGTFKEYKNLFSENFDINNLMLSKKSALPRKGFEFWVEFTKK